MKSVLALLCILSFSLYAGEYDSAKGQMLSLSCASCHGSDGMSSSSMPTIGGLGKATLYKALLDFKSGARPSTVMQKHAKGFSDEELEQIAFYFSNIHKH